MDAPIRLIKNFIKEPDLSSMVEYIDLLEATRVDDFLVSQNGKRLALQFGDDMFHPTSHKDLAIASDKNDLIKGYFTRIVDATKEAFEVETDLYVCSFWLAKQYQGAIIEAHEDTDGGHNTHFRYSGIVYLNTMNSGGDLVFGEYDYSYTPEAGDLLIFPSQGTGFHEVKEIFETRYSLPFWMTDVESMALGRD